MVFIIFICVRVKKAYLKETNLGPGITDIALYSLLFDEGSVIDS